MAAHEFVFALELSDEPRFDRMLTDLATVVLAHVGYSRTAAEELGGVLRRALADGLAKGRRRCDISFRAHAGELQIAVVYAGGREWRTTRQLP